MILSSTDKCIFEEIILVVYNHQIKGAIFYMTPVNFPASCIQWKTERLNTLHKVNKISLSQKNLCLKCSNVEEAIYHCGKVKPDDLFKSPVLNSAIWEIAIVFNCLGGSNYPSCQDLCEPSKNYANL